MLSLAPLKEKTEIEKIYKEKGFDYNEFSGCVLCKNGAEILGLCLYELTNKKITVNYIEPQADLGLADGILRSTLHVAAERSIMNAFYGKNIEEIIKKLKFVKNAEEKSLDIDKLFSSCCSCGK